MRTLLVDNGMLKRRTYAPRDFWPEQNGREMTFVDGGVSRIEQPSSAPLGIRVGSYTVRPGDETEGRERFNQELLIFDELFSPESVVYDDEFQDIGKLRDAARIISETAAAYRIAAGDAPPDLILLHGPLINPAAPYGLDDFPPFRQSACQTFLSDFSYEGGPGDRNFVKFYLVLLQKMKDLGLPILGVIERSIGKAPVVVKAMLKEMVSREHLKEGEAEELIEDIRLFGLNDASLLDVVLEDGEYVGPVAINRQGPDNKWPARWQEEIRAYPRALTTYIKPADTVMPFRVEAFEDAPDLDWALDVVLHTSRLLPTYGFPVGLDIVDKYAKVPEWMSRGVRSRHKAVLLRKAIETGDPRVLTFAKRILAAKGRDWLFRPEP